MLDPSVLWVVVCSADEVGMTSRRFSADVSGTTPTPAVTPAFRKLRRFSTGHSECDSKKVYQHCYRLKHQTSIDERVIAEALTDCESEPLGRIVLMSAI
jgi:hypothetical protein